MSTVRRAVKYPLNAQPTDDAGLLPDGAVTAELAVPALGIVAAGVGIGHENVDLTGGETRERAGVGVRLHMLRWSPSSTHTFWMMIDV